jgi:hypothetical protein
MPKLIQKDPTTGHIAHTDLPDGEYGADDINARTTTRAAQIATAMAKQAKANGWHNTQYDTRTPWPAGANVPDIAKD